MNTTDNELHDMIQPTCEEVYDEDRYGAVRPYEGGGWPGDGSGTDDFEDYNQSEASDYYGE
jgi:hypothetical protein